MNKINQKKFDKLIIKKIKKEQKSKKQWYVYKTLQTKYVIFYPLLIIVYWFSELLETINAFKHNSIKWNIKKTEKIISSVLLNKLYINSDKQELLTSFSVNGFGEIRWHWELKWYYRKLYKNYCLKYNLKITKYFLDEYEISGYKKCINNDYDTIHVMFKKV